MANRRTYYTLAVREGGVFAPQFGDYDRETVAQELEDLLDGYDAPRRKDCRILKTTDRQSDIESAVAALNAGEVR